MRRLVTEATEAMHHLFKNYKGEKKDRNDDRETTCYSIGNGVFYRNTTATVEDCVSMGLEEVTESEFADELGISEAWSNYYTTLEMDNQTEEGMKLTKDKVYVRVQSGEKGQELKELLIEAGEPLSNTVKDVLSNTHTLESYGNLVFADYNQWTLLSNVSDKGKTEVTINQLKNILSYKKNEGIKESEGKLSWEVDFDFLEEIALRMESMTKYPPYNWQKPLSKRELQKALFRHVMAIMRNNFEDDGQELGHIFGAATDLMMLYYQLKHYPDGE